MVNPQKKRHLWSLRRPAIVTDILCTNFLPCVFCAKDVINASVSAFSWWVREVSGRVPGFMGSWMDELHLATFIENITKMTRICNFSWRKHYLLPQVFGDGIQCSDKLFMTIEPILGIFSCALQQPLQHRIPPRRYGRHGGATSDATCIGPVESASGPYAGEGCSQILRWAAREEQLASSYFFLPMRPTKNKPDSLQYLFYFFVDWYRYSA